MAMLFPESLTSAPSMSWLTASDVPIFPFAVVLLAILLSIPLAIPARSKFTRVGKPWLLSFLSGTNAMSFTIEKHVQKGYDNVGHTIFDPARKTLN